MITLVHQRDIIKAVTTRWKEQFPNWHEHKRMQKIVHDLDDINLNTCYPEDVDNIIGNNMWAQNLCDECGQNSNLTVHIGPEPDYDTRWLTLCQYCITKAYQLITQTRIVE